MLNRNAQVGIAVETTEGTEVNLVAADFAGNRKQSSHSYSRNEYRRELDRGTLTGQPRLLSSYGGRITWTEEAVGGAANTAAPWHRTLRGMGFSSAQLQANECGAVTNQFVPGQLVGDKADKASATKLARVVGVFNSKLVYLPVSGGNFSNGETITGYDFSPVPSTTLSGAAAAAGYGFAPLTETDEDVPPSCTVERRLGGQRHTIVGARGTGQISMRQNEPLLLAAEFLGVPVFADAATMAPRSGAKLSPTPITAAPRMSRGIPLRMRKATAADTPYTPIATELVLQLNNTLAQRGTITDRELQNSTYSSGFMATRITGRDPIASLDPEHILPADGFDFIGELQLGTVFAISAQVGLHSDSNGAVVVAAPAVQLIGDHEPGDRDGVTTAPLQLALTGDQDDELYLFHVFA